MPKRNILVTGVNGFIGRALIKGLDPGLYNVYGLDQNTPENLNTLGLTEIFHQDLTVPFTLDLSFDYIIHLAALNVTHIGKAAYSDYHRINVQGTENLIQAVETRNFIFMSTVKVYQSQEGVVDEESPVKPEGEYERSKLEGEKICQSHFSTHELTIIRASNIVGSGQAEKAVIPVFFKKALNNEPLKLIYPAQTVLQILDVDDLLRAFYLLLEKGQGAGIINLCSEETITLGRLAEEIVTLCGSKSIIDAVQGNELSGTKFVSGKVKKVLGWEMQTPLQDILKKYYKSFSVYRS